MMDRGGMQGLVGCGEIMMRDEAEAKTLLCRCRSSIADATSPLTRHAITFT